LCYRNIYKWQLNSERRHSLLPIWVSISAIMMMPRAARTTERKRERKREREREREREGERERESQGGLLDLELADAHRAYDADSGN
jgi:hypothetical protein